MIDRESEATSEKEERLDGPLISKMRGASKNSWIDKRNQFEDESVKDCSVFPRRQLWFVSGFVLSEFDEPSRNIAAISPSAHESQSEAAIKNSFPRSSFSLLGA